MSDMINFRSLFLHVFFRPFKYAVFIYIIIVPFSFFLGWFDLDFENTDRVYNRNLFYLFDSLIKSPIVETIILYFVFYIYKTIKLGQLSGKIIFVLSVSLISWSAHGMNYGAIFPSVMFLLSSIYLLRTSNDVLIFHSYAFFGAFVIHVIYNLPYAISLYF